MKRKLLFLAALAVSALGFNANAQSFSGEDGKYYLQNVESGLYWGAGNSWGTQASLVKNPEYVTLISNGDGTYKMDSQVSNGGENHYFNGDFMDNNSPISLTITASGDNYTIANDNNYFGYDGTSTVLGKNLEATSPNVLWKITSEADMKASLANATAENPVNATFLILDPNFGRNNRNKSSWSMVADNQNLAGGDNTNTCAESYHAVFTLSQKITNAPKGVYKLTAQGFYRKDEGATADIPYIYINDVQSPFNEKTGAENNMGDASASFTNGLYAIAPAFVELTADGDITVGAKLATNTALWCIWDNFELTYYGSDATIADVKFGDLIKQVEALREQAEALKANENVSAPTVAKLEAALSGSEEIEANEEAYNAAIVTLTAAVQQANKDVANKPAIDAMYELMESTNVYTTEAYNTYKALADDYLAKYNAGTLTETVVNPSIRVDWNHNAAAEKTFLLSAWSIGGEKANDYEKALYINNWSTEGYDDGTNFGVPFFEYWVGDADVLGNNTLTATVEGVEPGEYIVSAWVRIRATNGKNVADAAGINLSVNDGEVVDVTKGEQIGESQFRIAEYKAIGTVDEDGKLNIKFDVTTENINWLSFKNVKYSKVLDIDGVDYVITGNNLFVNGSFDEGITGWKAETYVKDAVASNATFSETGGYDGGKYFTSKGGGSNAATTLRQAIKVEPGKTYYFSVYTSGMAPDANNFNYNALFNLKEDISLPNTEAEDGLIKAFEWPQGAAQTTSEWNQTEYVFTATHPYVGVRMAWCPNASFDGFELYELTLLNPATEEDYQALNDAMEGKALGFEKGEYAPYTNAEAAKALAIAKSINQDVPNDKAAVNEATKALTEAEWTANEEEVNGIYDGTFALQEEHTTGPTALVGWNNVEGIRQLVKDTEKYPGLEYTNDKAAVFSWGGTTLTYGEQSGYTLPLKGNTIYELTLKIAGWQDGDLPTYIDLTVPGATVENGRNNVSVQRLTSADGNPFVDVKFKFTTGEAKDYVVQLISGKHNVVTDIALYRYSTSVEVSDAGYATYVTAEDVEFGDEVEAYIVSGLKEDNTVATLERITEAPKGTPVVIKAAEGTYKLNVIGEAEEVDGENLLKVAEGTETGAGIYVLANLTQGVGFYALQEGVTVPAGKAYLNVPAGGGIKFIGFEGNGGATGIQGVENAAEVENGAIYNLAGQRVQNPTKGIYIVNGKKVLVK